MSDKVKAFGLLVAAFILGSYVLDPDVCKSLLTLALHG
jgi:hypothetical protein